MEVLAGTPGGAVMMGEIQADYLIIGRAVDADGSLGWFEVEAFHIYVSMDT